MSWEEQEDQSGLVVEGYVADSCFDRKGFAGSVIRRYLGVTDDQEKVNATAVEGTHGRKPDWRESGHNHRGRRASGRDHDGRCWIDQLG